MRAQVAATVSRAQWQTTVPGLESGVGLVWSISGTTVPYVLVAFAASDADELLDAASVS